LVASPINFWKFRFGEKGFKLAKLHQNVRHFAPISRYKKGGI